MASTNAICNQEYDTPWNHIYNRKNAVFNKTFFGAHWLEVLELQQHGVVLWGRKLRRGTMYLGGDDAGVTCDLTWRYH